jgi:DNA-binding response OmpR family regulator
MKTLLVKEEETTGESIQIALDAEGIAVDWIKNGIDAETTLAQRGVGYMVNKV